MIPVRYALILLLVVEIAVIGWLFADRLRRPEPPVIDVTRLDSSTATDLQNLRRRVIEESTPDTWQELAEAYMAYGYFPQAEVCYEYRDRIEPQSVYATFGWAYCLERLGRMREAIVQFRRAAERADDQLVQACWYHVGRNALCLEDAAQAESAFRKVKQFPPAKYQLAKLLVRSGRVNEAMPLLDEMDEQSPRELVVLQLRARAEDRLGNRAAAATFRDRAERADHELVLNEGPELLNPMMVRYGLGKDLYRCGSFRESGFLAAESQCIYDVFREHPDQWWYLRRAVMQCAKTEIQLGNSGRALDLLDWIFEHTNVTAEALELLGDAWHLKGSPERARDAWDRSWRMRPSETVHRKLAAYFRQNENPEAANRHAALADHEAGRVAFGYDQLEIAQKAFARAVERRPDLAHSWYYLGEVRRLLGNLPESRAAFHHCLEQDPYHGRALDRLERISEQNAVSGNPPVLSAPADMYGRNREKPSVTYSR